MMRVGNESYAMKNLKASLSRINKRQDNCSSRKVSWKKENLCRVFKGRTGDRSFIFLISGLRVITPALGLCCRLNLMHKYIVGAQ